MNSHKGSPRLHLCRCDFHSARSASTSYKRENVTLLSFPWEVMYVLHCRRRAGNRLALGTGVMSFSLLSEHKNLSSSYFYHSSSHFIAASYSYLKSNAFNVKYIVQSKFDKQHTFRLLNLYISTSLSVVNSSIDLRRFNGHLVLLA